MGLLEYINNIYVLPGIAVIIGLAILFIYDYFEKKQYNNAVYLRIGILIYISCISIIYISRQLNSIQSGGGNIETVHNVMPAPNELHNSYEHFKTGIPTF